MDAEINILFWFHRNSHSHNHTSLLLYCIGVKLFSHVIKQVYVAFYSIKSNDNLVVKVFVRLWRNLFFKALPCRRNRRRFSDKRRHLWRTYGSQLLPDWQILLHQTTRSSQFSWVDRGTARCLDKGSAWCWSGCVCGVTDRYSGRAGRTILDMRKAILRGCRMHL